MRIGQKLILGFLSIALLVGVVGYICIAQNKKTQHIFEEQVYISISYLDNIWKLMEAQEHQEIAANNYLFLDEGLQEKRANYFYAKETLGKIYQKYRKEACEHAKAWIERYHENIKRYNIKIEESFELYQQGAAPELIKATVRQANKYAETAHEDALEPIIEHVYKTHLEPAKQDIAKGINRTTSITIIMSMFSVFLAIVAGLFISHSISTPITILKNAAIEIGKGKLNTKIEINSTNEIGQLAGAFNKMTDDLQITTTSIDNLNAANQQLSANEQQLRAANQQLESHKQQLMAANQQLESEISERKQVERDLQKLLCDMEERIKEINCMYGVISSIHQQKSLDDIFQDVVTIIPSSWRYPEIACAKICFHGTEHVSKPFKETQWTQKSDIVVKGESCGSVKVCYLEERPVEHEGPFLKEERHLIEGVATVLSEAITYKHIEEEIKNLAKFPTEDPNPVLRISADCKITYANNASTPILKAWKCREGQSLQPPQSKLVKEVLNLGKSATFEFNCQDQLFSVTMAPVVESGYVNVYGLDITELKLSKETLKQVREQTDKKNQFVSIVSHELRTPLTSMKGSVDILLNKAVGEINDKQENLLDITKRNIDRLNRLINDVLDFQKLEANKTKFDMQKNDMNEIVKEIKETISPLVNEEELKVVTKLDETLPKVYFDRNSIIQVLTNLVDNAFKFTDKGSIKITTNKSDNTIRVSVEDTGIGIKKEDLPKLFNEFEQLSDVNNRKTGGTGLGLAICREIIKEHEGKIWAESEFGQGTCISFTLPIRERRSRA
ncbi:ATP-binding protein [Planctomycetota bacterium]